MSIKNQDQTLNELLGMTKEGIIRVMGINRGDLNNWRIDWR